MPPQETQQQPTNLYDARASFNLFNAVANVHAKCLLPFTRCHMGKHGMGLLPSIFAAFLMLAYAQYARAPEMLLFCRAWLVMAVLRRLTADRRQHTEYEGWPWLFGFLRNQQLARLLEAGSLWLIGGWLSTYSVPLGRFVAAGAFSYGFKYAVDRIVDGRMQDAAHDAPIEMAWLQRTMEKGRRY